MKEVIFENGSVAYVGKGQQFALQAEDGGEVPVAEERELGALTPQAQQELHQRNRTLIGEKKKGRWQAREMTLQEQVDHKIISGEEAEEIARARHGKR